jgi:hypothetical protein
MIGLSVIGSRDEMKKKSTKELGRDIAKIAVASLSLMLKISVTIGILQIFSAEFWITPEISLNIPLPTFTLDMRFQLFLCYTYISCKLIIIIMRMSQRVIKQKMKGKMVSKPVSPNMQVIEAGNEMDVLP